ncbi:hypothetical protein NDU88_003323 [Pleurodeles waltl]|uniref:Uncharacterized protein n=1 Tax=Pleurodeles waltl TaxID=8319 RepID=A0AAV7M6R5_PLEWA|nr:hypothetical protein NDU88_003323 [Pleurodeles waltl]
MATWPVEDTRLLPYCGGMSLAQNSPGILPAFSPLTDSLTRHSEYVLVSGSVHRCPRMRQLKTPVNGTCSRG